MLKYSFSFNGGSKKVGNGTYKFHAYVAMGKEGYEGVKEFHIFEAQKQGVVERIKSGMELYKFTCATPIVKIFTSSSGFGIPSEYFSYFVLLDSNSTKQIEIRPFGHEELSSKNYFFSFIGSGRFLTENEIISIYGRNSNTVKFYRRQAFIPKSRLKQLVTISEVDEFTGEYVSQNEVIPKVRKLNIG